jgi:hypothetical protein
LEIPLLKPRIHPWNAKSILADSTINSKMCRYLWSPGYATPSRPHVSDAGRAAGCRDDFAVYLECIFKAKKHRHWANRSSNLRFSSILALRWCRARAPSRPALCPFNLAFQDEAILTAELDRTRKLLEHRKPPTPPKKGNKH